MAYSSMDIFEGISDQSLAYLTGVTGSCGSRSTCKCNISRQNDARKSCGTVSSDIHLQFEKKCFFFIKLLFFQKS